MGESEFVVKIFKQKFDSIAEKAKKKNPAFYRACMNISTKDITYGEAPKYYVGDVVTVGYGEGRDDYNSTNYEQVSTYRLNLTYTIGRYLISTPNASRASERCRRDCPAYYDINMDYCSTNAIRQIAVYEAEQAAKKEIKKQGYKFYSYNLESYHIETVKDWFSLPFYETFFTYCDDKGVNRIMPIGYTYYKDNELYTSLSLSVPETSKQKLIKNLIIYGLIAIAIIVVLVLIF